MTPNRVFLLSLLVPVLGAAACGDAGPRVEIEARRTASRPTRPVLPGATPSQRFSAQSPRPAGSDDLLTYALPEGWKLLAPTGDRLLNVQPAGNPDGGCYLSFLSGPAGGLAANVNRWLAQFGADPLEPAVAEALPKHPMLGRDATLVSVEGTFTGMGETSRPGFALLGLVVCEPNGSLFLKFTGPAALVAAERERFLAFASSLGIPGEEHGPGDGHDHGTEEEHTPDDGHDHSAGAAGGDVAPAGPLAWTAPEGWRQSAPREFREVTFELGPPGSGAECYVSLLARDGGGLLANFNRWAVQQMGREPLTDADVAGLPKVELLGAEAPLIALEGDFTDMSGTTREGHGLLGTALIRPDESVFVKLTGPADVVEAERERFVAFVGSLEERR